MSTTQKKNNFIITVSCPELNINDQWVIYSKQLQKFINEHNKFKNKRHVINSYSEFLEKAAKSYDSGALEFLGIHNVGDLVNFIYQHYELQSIRHPGKEILKATLRSIIYRYINLDDTK